MSQGKFTFLAVALMLVCAILGALSDATTPAAANRSAQAAPLRINATQSPTASQPAATATPNVEITMLFLGATDTAIAIAKTEVEIHNQRETQASKDLEVALQLTSQAQQAEIAATQQYWIDATSTQIAVTATSGMATLAATWTQGAAVGATGTQAYYNLVTATQLANTQEIERSARLAKQASIFGGVIVFLLAALAGVAWLGVLVWRSWKIARAEYLQASAIEPDAQGRHPLLPTDALGKHGKVINPNLAHRATIDPEHDDLTAEQALANAQGQRELEATRAIAQSPALLRSALRKPVTAVTPELPEAHLEISRPAPGMLPDGRPGMQPEWSVMQSWDGQGGIPYGISARGLERLSIQQVPHGGIFGQTGKGKSRYFLRPFIAAAIAAGQRVVILGKQADFWPFAHHPNVTMIPVRHITQPEEAARYAGYLKRLVEEMNRRDDYLTSHQVSTWDRAGRENTLIVLDELGNALDMMPRDVAAEAYRWVQGLVKEGRKAGFNVWLASQRAVGFKSIVEQLGRAVFYLADADASRHALGIPGAETLTDGHFYAKFQGLRKCAAFDPSDQELVDFLGHHPVKAHEPIDWIEGEVSDVAPAPAAPAQTSGDPEEDRIREILNRMIQEDRVSLRQVEQEVWGRVRGGQYFSKVQNIYKQMKTNGTTTMPDMPESGAIAPL